VSIVCEWWARAAPEDWPLQENRHHGEGSESNKPEFADIPEEDCCTRFRLGRSQCYMAYITSPHSTGTPVDSSLNNH
jgi:hypothetical protein